MGHPMVQRLFAPLCGGLFAMDRGLQRQVSLFVEEAVFVADY